MEVNVTSKIHHLYNYVLFFQIVWSRPTSQGWWNNINHDSNPIYILQDEGDPSVSSPTHDSHPQISLVSLPHNTPTPRTQCKCFTQNHSIQQGGINFLFMYLFYLNCASSPVQMAPPCFPQQLPLGEVCFGTG